MSKEANAREIKDMLGIDYKDALEALNKFDNDKTKAIDYLLNQGTSSNNNQSKEE